MNSAKKILAGSISASVLAISAVPAAHAELSGSVGVASSYLWRGFDLGYGSPAVSGDLSYSAAGAYGGVWVSSGDDSLGTEYDLYVGYGTSFGDFSVDLSLWSYNYPNYNTDDEGAPVSPPSTFDGNTASDFVLGLGFGPVSFGAYVPIGEGSSGDYMYFTLGATFGQFSATLGMHSDSACDTGEIDPLSGEAIFESCDPTHLNLDYAYNDNLTFTFSQFVADEPDADKLKVVVSYSIPIGE